ncbi:MAG TPA: MFS transporter [Candidatus Krumholzibacteria bacterium]|nr:MFS transporter [Candidatus Krumholzibacteria bacterium]
MTAWARDISPAQWKTLWAALLGWMLDGMDIMLYAFALSSIRAEFHLSAAGAGALASVTLVSSACGGVLFGYLADRIGRARALIYSILTYSVFTALMATSRGVADLVFWRALVGFGLGGEWAAGSVLVSETWPARHRGKAIGFMQSGWAIGYILAALCAALVLPRYGWRALFAIGILPALLTLWIRRHVSEPEIWTPRRISVLSVLAELSRPPLLRRTAIATLMGSCVLFAYWGLFTWIPTFLAAPVEEGGAGLGLVRSAGWIVPMQLGAFCGYTLFGFGADRFGRRPMFIAFLLGAAALVPIYTLGARREIVLILLGPWVGFFGHGYFSVFGSLLAELFPTRIRATAQGLAYNSGRAVSALAPFTIGALADRAGLGPALATTSAFFLLGAGLILLLPETRGTELMARES